MDGATGLAHDSNVKQLLERPHVTFSEIFSRWVLNGLAWVGRGRC